MQALIPRFPLRTLSLALCTALPLLAEAAVAGRFQFVLGDVRIVGLNGQERPAQKGQEILEGETLRTGPNASAQVKMIDGGLIAMRPESQIKLDAYSTAGIEQGREKAAISLAKGGFRTVTGLIGKDKKENYSVTTTTATIGIRGTDHTPVVVAPPLPGAPATDPPGTYDKVTVGATSLTTPAGTALIERNQVGFASTPTQAPTILPRPPAFYQQATPPANKQESTKGSQQSQTQGGSSSTATKTEDQSTTTDSTASSSTSSTSSGTTNSSTTTSGSQTSTGTTAEMRLSAPGDISLTSEFSSSPTGLISTFSSTSTSTTSTTTLPTTGTDSSGNVLNTASTIGVALRTYKPGPALVLGSGGYRHWASGPLLTLTYNSSGHLTKSNYDDPTDTRYTYTSNNLSASYMSEHTATGLRWGRWTGGQADYERQIYSSSSTTTAAISLASSSLHWLTGQGANPNFLAKILTGTASYTYVGGTSPTDTLGNVGTLTSATLSANFTNQTVNAGIGLSINSNSWSLQTNGIPLGGGSQFDIYLCSGCSLPASTSYTLTKNGSSAVSTTNVTLTGRLMSTDLSSAGLSYTLIDNSASTVYINGVAGFSGPAQNTATTYRIGGINNGYAFDYWTASGSPTYLPNFKGTLWFEAAPENRVAVDANGLTEFAGSARYTATGSTSISYEPLITAKIGTATNQDVGSTVIDGKTIYWGRWAGGIVDIYSQNGSSKIGTIDNTGKNFHWIATGTLSGMPNGSLPLTGTVAYTLAGATRPTDQLGNVGTLNSITLNADFGAMRVEAAVSASFTAANNNATWTMNAKNVPLTADGRFDSHSSLNGINSISHTTTCSGTGCGSVSHSVVNGTFIGTGASGAVLRYGMSTGSTGGTSYTGLPANYSPSNGIGGVAVLKK